MRLYTQVTGIVFALIFVAHLARVAAEGVGTLGKPVFAVTTLIALGLALWAWRALRRKP